jgi:hypothetical protein
MHLHDGCQRSTRDPMRRNKRTKLRDSEIISEAAQGPTMKLVAIKTADQIEARFILAEITSSCCLT